MILTVTLNPSVDHALFVSELRVNDTNRATKCFKDAGGKGVNLSRVLAELGTKTTATGFLGGGPGAYIRSVLDRQGVNHHFIDIEGDTRVNFSVEEERDTPPTTFNEPGPFVSPVKLDELKTLISNLALRASWVCLGGSLPPGIPSSVYSDLIQALGPTKIALDADGEPLSLAIGQPIGLLKPNTPEAERLIGRELESDADAIEAVRWLGEKAEFAFISRGEQGAVLANEGKVWIGDSPNVDAQSTIGSGDSFIAGFLWAITTGHPVPDAFRWALAAGAATAMTDGSEIGRRSMIESLFHRAAVTNAD